MWKPAFRLIGAGVLVGFLMSSCAPATAPPAPAPTSAPAAKAAAATPTPPPAPTPAPPTPTPKPEKVKMATPSVGLVEMPEQLAKKKGFYAQENVEVEITRMATDIGVKALVGGEIDFTFSAGSATRAAAQGLPVKGVTITIAKPYHVLVVRPEIKEGKDLKGKVFAISGPGDSPTQMIRAALRHYSLDPDRDITLVALGGNPERLAGLKSGIVQATVLEPVYAMVAEKEGLKQLLRMADIMDMPLAGLAASDKMIKERPDLILRVVRATVKSLKYIKDPKNKDEMLSYLISELNVSRDDAVVTYTDIVRAFGDDGMASEESIMQEVKAAIETAGAKPNTTISDVFDFSFVRKVKEGG